MREIKFRAWIDKMISCDWDGKIWSYKPYKAMKEVKSVHFGTGKIIISDKHGNHSEHPSDYALMQYTGLKDKNGVEIYEGDIIHAFGAPLEVKWIVDGWFADCEKTRICEAGQEWDDNCEVIGNIHENPELLK